MIKKTNGLSRDLIIHPGETLRDILEEREMSQRELAIRTGVTEKHISTIINGLKPISVVFAKKLEYVLEVDASFWINLQSNYDKELLDFEELNNISKDEFAVLKKLKDVLEYFAKIGILESGLSEASKVLETRKILRISRLNNIQEVSFNGAYRASANDCLDKYVLFAWQRLCDIKTSEIQLETELDLSKLKEKIPYIKGIMFEDALKIQEKLTKIFSECGIAFAIVKSFTGAPVHGFIKQNESGKIILAMTIRRAYADIFWFTLFHEIAHIINGDIKQKLLVDYSFVENEIEKKANQMASNILINSDSYQDFIEKEDFSLPSINKFANDQNVKNFIVIGRLQKDNYLKYSSYNGEKARYTWAED